MDSYAAGRYVDFYRMSVDSSGISAMDVTRQPIYTFVPDFEFDNGRVYVPSGEVIDPVTRRVVGKYMFPQGFSETGGWVISDSSAGRTFFLTDRVGGSIRLPLLVYHQRNLGLVGTLEIPGVVGSPQAGFRVTSLIRWGADGLAFRSSGGQVFILRAPSLIPPAGAPGINQGGTVNAASFAPGAPVAAGSVASVFGVNLAISATFAGAIPLPTTLAGASLRLGGFPVPLFYISPQQVNFQVPWELAGQNQAPLTLTVGGTTTSPITVNLATQAPGIFTTTQTGSGQGAVLDAQGRLVNSAAPTRAGDVLQIYCTGLGPVTNQPASGAAAPIAPLATTRSTPTVTIGGVPATVTFSGLAPGFVGLYQVNVTVPDGVPAGDDVPVVLNMGGATSNTVTIAVR